MSSGSTQTSKRTATRWVVALTAIGSLMAALDTLVVSTSLSTIRLDLGASIEDLEWTVNAYNLSFAVLLITAAALGDRYGRRSGRPLHPPRTPRSPWTPGEWRV
jgi:MFS family permease